MWQGSEPDRSVLNEECHPEATMSTPQKFILNDVDNLLPLPVLKEEDE